MARTQRRVRSLQGRSHSLPSSIMWLIILLTATGMAILNFFTIWAVRKLVEWKFETMQKFCDDWHVAAGVIVLVGICSVFATIATVIIHKVSAAAGGSGAPENKGWLNGNPIPNFFTWTNMWVRAVAVLLANASGYPVGREGPSVTMGSNLAYLITAKIGIRYTQQRVDVGRTSTGRKAAARVDDDEALGNAQRLACAVGGACAMAMIFDAPIGGVLYMIEEISVASWPLELTFYAFVGTTVCTLLSYFLLGLCGTTLKAFVLYDHFPCRFNCWDYRDIPYFILLAVILGPFSALHTKVALYVGLRRQQMHARLSNWQPYAKMVEAVLFAAACALLCALTSLMARCEGGSDDMTLSFVQFNCGEDAYNPVASLLLTTSEGAVRRLFSHRNTGQINGMNTMWAFLTYTLINVGLTGIPVPSGNFTGTMLIGGLVGRCMGSLVNEYVHPCTPGIYAMAGSAAMLSGFKQISMGVVVFIGEAANDLGLTPVLMMSVTISLLLNKRCLKSGFDEEQILRKNIPFLPPQLPSMMDFKTAGDLCERPPVQAILPPATPVWMVLRALKVYKGKHYFPVVNDDLTCIGFTTRQRLKAALEALNVEEDGDGTESEPSDDHSELNRTLPVANLTDPIPYMIPEAATAEQFYQIFAKAGANVCCVASDVGKFRGIISRGALIPAVRLAEEAAESDDDDDSSTDLNLDSDESRMS